MKRQNYIFWVFAGILLMSSCKNDTTTVKRAPSSTTPKTVKVPSFKQDSAYAHIEKQLSFGIRVPGTPTHKACKDWMVSKFKSYGADVIEQDFTANIYNGEKWASTNIIAQFNKDKKKRVILSAHWDSRFIAEMDENKAKKDQPIPGADDGGSGTGVLIEIGRLIQENPIDLGVDIILWDAEDQGDPSKNPVPDSWCLGSQYWSKKKHVNNYRADWGINLDMIGAKNPRFGKDDASKIFAGTLLNKVWTLAQNMGYSDMFVNENTGGLTDDHVYVSRVGKVPMIDIINQPSNGSFMDKWHTHGDDIDNISKRSLKVVGQVVTAAIYKESIGKL